MRRAVTRPLSSLAAVATCWATVAAGLTPPTAVAADEPAVVAVVAVDPYAELKQQAKWVGGQIDQPTLDGFLESFIMMATQFKGLAGLDVNRPAGVVVTAEGPAGVPVVRGFVPVKDLGKLLAALQGVIGPVQEQDGVKVLSPPGMPPLEIVERDGWAIVSLKGSPDAAAGLEQSLDPVVKAFSLGVQLFPARMPEGMRQQLQAVLRQAAALQAQQGQPVDPDALAKGLESLERIETLLLGANVDVAKELVSLENRFVMVPGSAEATLYNAMARAAPSVPAAATADGKPAAVSGHAAVAIPESLREAAKAATGMVEEPVPMIVKCLLAIVQEMLDAGVLDAAVTVDTSAKPAAGEAVPRVTLGMRVKDGPALEAALEAALGAEGVLPAGVTAKFDAGKAGGANLHVLAIERAQEGNFLDVLLGEKVTATLAVTPTHAFLLLGDDVEKRIATAAGGKPDAQAKPLGDLDVSLGPLMAWKQARSNEYRDKNRESNTPEQKQAEAELQEYFDAQDRDAKRAAALPSSLVQLLVRPIERGVATRVSADAGAIRALKMISTGPKPEDTQPAGFGPGPVPNRQPVPLPGLAP